MDICIEKVAKQYVLRSLACIFMILFLSLASSWAQQDGKIEEAIQQRAKYYVDEKKKEYVARTERLKAMLKALGGAVPSGPRPQIIPEPTRITIKVKRISNVRKPVLTGSDFISLRRVRLKPQKITTRYPKGLIAADGLTANALGLPRYLHLEVEGGIVRVKQKACRVKVSQWEDMKYGPDKKVKEETKTIGYDAYSYEEADLRGLLKEGKGNENSIGILLKGTNLQYDIKAGALKARDSGRISPPALFTYKAPSKIEIRASTSRDTKRYSLYEEAYNCKITDLIRFGKLHSVEYRPRPSDMENFPREAIEIVNADIIGEKGVEKDIFFTGGSDYLRKLSFQYKPILNEEKWSRFVRLRNFYIDREADVPFMIRKGANGHFSVKRASNSPGKVKITAYLLFPDGKRALQRSITITANRIKGIAIDAIPMNLSRVGDSLVRVLSIGKEYIVTMTVNGPADMSRYKVRWNQNPPLVAKNVQAKIVFDPEESRFENKGDQVWVATAKVRIPPDPSYTKMLGGFMKHAGGEIRACISNTFYCSKGISVRVAPPMITAVALLGSYKEGSNVASGPFDLFLGSSKGIYLYADVGFKGKKGIRQSRTRLPVKWIRVQQDKGRRLRKEGNMLLPVQGRTGTARIRAVIRGKDVGQDSLPSGKGFIASKPVLVRISRVFLVKESNGYRLGIDGPADANKYRVRWRFVQNGKEATRISRFDYSFRTEGVQLQLNSVEMLDIKGQIVAIFRPTNMPTISPRIELNVAGGSLVQGIPQRIIANISNLPAHLARHSIVKWHFAWVVPRLANMPADRSVLSAMTRLRQTGNGYKSSIMVIYPDDPSTAGKKPLIEAELLLIGHKKPKGRIKK